VPARWGRIVPFGAMEARDPTDKHMHVMVHSMSHDSRHFVLAPHHEIDHKILMSSAFLEQLAAPHPFPGGGSAASHVGALALALVEKVVRLEMKRSEEDTETTAIWSGRLARVANLTEKFQFLCQEDGRVYAQMSNIRRHASEADVISEAVREASMVPLQMMRAAAHGLSLISESSTECKTYLVPDLQVSCELLLAVARGAETIAAANVILMESAANRTELRTLLIEARKDARGLYEKTRTLLQEHAPSCISRPATGED
jgi:methenyltetrahydrofolate cyclohydrolase